MHPELRQLNNTTWVYREVVFKSVKVGLHTHTYHIEDSNYKYLKLTCNESYLMIDDAFPSIKGWIDKYLDTVVYVEKDPPKINKIDNWTLIYRGHTIKRSSVYLKSVTYRIEGSEHKDLEIPFNQTSMNFHITYPAMMKWVDGYIDKSVYVEYEDFEY